MKKNKILKISFVFLFVFISLSLLTTYALSVHGSGDECFTFDIDTNGYPVTSITINGDPWTDDAGGHQYRTSNNKYVIEVIAGKKGDSYPWISTAGGLDDYKTYVATENPDDDENVVGDEYKLTLTIDGIPYDKQNGCLGFGVSLQDGPFPVLPQIPASADITISVSGSELEYHYVESKPDEADVTRFKFAINSEISDDLVPFTFGNANYVNMQGPHADGASTKEPIHYEYIYDGTGYVNFCVNGGADDNYTHIYINGIDYADQAPHSQIEVFEHLVGRASRFCIENVPYVEQSDEPNTVEYEVVVTGERQPIANTVAGFGWSYLSADRSNISQAEEGNFAHGRLEFVQAVYTDIDANVHLFNSAEQYNSTKFHGTGEIYEWHDGQKNYIEEDRRTASGSALVPYGTVLKVRIVPDEGYQLVGLSANPNGFQATDDVGVYQLTLTQENFSLDNSIFDLNPVFAEVGAEVRADSNKVSEGTITTTETVQNGSIKLEVTDANVSGESRTSFENRAAEDGFTVDSYLDLSLYNSIYKGGKKDNNNNYLSWDAPMSTLDDDASITLKLSDEVGDNDIIVIHEHGNSYTVINPTYNSNDNTITFATDSFSTYAIALKSNAQSQEPVVNHTVTFDTQGGSNIDSVEVEHGHVVTRPADPTNGNKVFGGWYMEANCENPYNFSSEVNDDIVIFAKWEDPKEHYDVVSGDYTLSFDSDEGQTYNFQIADFLTVPKETVMAAEDITSEEYDVIVGLIFENSAQYGTLLALYDIEISNPSGPQPEGPFVLKIKLTEEMKQYNTFNLLYLEDDFSFSTVIKMTVVGDYAVSEPIPHFSNYGLVGSYTAPNPQTGDNIYIWFISLILGIITLGIYTICMKKKQKN